MLTTDSVKNEETQSEEIAEETPANKYAMSQSPEKWLEEHAKQLAAFSRKSEQDQMIDILRKWVIELKIPLPKMEVSNFSPQFRCEALNKAVKTINQRAAKRASEEEKQND